MEKIYYIPPFKLEIHLKHKLGVFSLVKYNNNGFYYKTNNTEPQYALFYKFHKLKGGQFIPESQKYFVEHFLKCMSLETWKSKKVLELYENSTNSKLAR